jgi:hypothetical protein
MQLPRRGLIGLWAASPAPRARAIWKRGCMYVPMRVDRDQFVEDIDRHLDRLLNIIPTIPIAVLIWGPSPTAGTITADTRVQLRDRLNTEGHVARFSEELIRPGSPYSVPAQQAAQVRAHDIVFSIPDSPGSIAEIHDFVGAAQISEKIVTFLDESWNAGYSNLSLIQLQTIGTIRGTHYDATALPYCIIDSALDMVRRLQEIRYCFRVVI